VLDFLVLTVPLSTPLWVNGEYWQAASRTARTSWYNHDSAVPGLRRTSDAVGEQLQTQRMP